MRSVHIACIAVLLAGCPKNETTTTSSTATATATSTSTATASVSAAGSLQRTADGADRRPPTADGSTVTDQGPRFVAVPSEADALSTIRIEAQRASKEGRVVVVYVGATWCPPCRKLHAALQTEAAKSKLAGVTLLAFDVDTDGDRLNALGYGSKYIPFFAAPRADGRASDLKMDTNFKKTASGEEVIDKLAEFVVSARGK